ncbi:MAG: choice-of-anchor Q domain-containing protein [Anaerolineae bacterium]
MCKIISSFTRALLILTLCLIPTMTSLADPPDETPSPAPPTHEDLPPVPDEGPLPQEDPAQAALLRYLSALEKARNESPEAFLALAETYPVEIRELVQGEILAAQRILGLAPEEPEAEINAAPWVGINGSACTYFSIPDAVSAAAAGDTLYLRAGTFGATAVTINGKSLTIAGGYGADCVTPGAGTTILTGIAGWSVFDIQNAVVVLRNLGITGGGGPSTIGGGVDADNYAFVTLDNTDVYSNSGNFGGGVFIGPASAVTATHDSDIYQNTASAYGGGVRIWGTFTANDNDSDIYKNIAPHGGGISAVDGTVYLSAADVYQNEATAPTGKGGGILLDESSILTTTGSVFIYFMNTAYDGAGVYAFDSDIFMLNGTTLRDNHASHYGGAVYLTNGSTLSVSNTSSIGQPGTGLPNSAALGGGIYAITSTLQLQGQVVNNEASSAGAGIYASNCDIELNGVTVGGTFGDTPNRLLANGHEGAGIYLTNATRATVNNSVIIGNSFATLGYTYGGGLYITGASVVTLTNSSIEQHNAPSLADGRGAAMYINGSTVTLDNTDVLSNTAGAAGAGIRVYNSGTLTITNGSELRNNFALTGEGGALAVTNGDINLSDVFFNANMAGTHGGAIYQAGGTLDLTGGWTFHSNTAGMNGGAIAIYGATDADLQAQRYSMAYNNVAQTGSGGALYLANNDSVMLYANNGALLDIYANHAQLHGGALYANAGGFFDIYGQVMFDHNWATAGNGGAVYLANGSQIVLDDYITTRPAMIDNRAYAGHGGAIYAENSPRVELDGTDIGAGGEGNYTAGGSGGALYLAGSNLSAENSTFRGNHAALHGGAIAAYTSTVLLNASFAAPVSLGVQAEEEQRTSAAIQATRCDPSAGRCSSLSGNTADYDLNGTGNGGAVYAQSSTMTITHSYLDHNTGLSGGAIYQTGAMKTVVKNSLIYANTSTIALGAGVRTDGGLVILQHVTIADNLGGAGYSQSATDSSVVNSIAWGNQYSGFLGVFTLAECNIDQSGNAGENLDPQFVYPAGFNYHLLAASPAVDACANGLPTDLSGVTRPKMSAYDMGAFEYVPTIYVPLTLKN